MFQTKPKRASECLLVATLAALAPLTAQEPVDRELRVVGGSEAHATSITLTPMAPVAQRPHATLQPPNHYIAPTPVIGGIRSGLPAPEPLISGPNLPVGTGFPGLTQNGLRPPDATIAVGENENDRNLAWILQTTNSDFAVYDHLGTFQWQMGLQALWGLPGTAFVFDPKCFYDQVLKRWVVVALLLDEPNQVSEILLAVTRGENAGSWWSYRTSVNITIGNDAVWADYPGLGYDRKGYYVTANLFTYGTRQFRGVLYRVFKKPEVNQGSVTPVDIIAPNTTYGSVQVAHTYGSGNPEPYLVSAYHTSVSSAVRVEAIRNPRTNPTLVSFDVPVATYYSPGTNHAQQQGNCERLDVMNGRVMNAAWRNGKLYAAHAVRTSNATPQTKAVWYQLRTGAWPGSGTPTLDQQGVVDPPGDDRWAFFPAINANADDSVGLVMAVSSLNEPAGVYYTARAACDPPGSMRALTQVRLSNQCYQDKDAGDIKARWGDFFGITIDGRDDQTFWVVGEYAIGSLFWGTEIASFTLNPPTRRTLTVQTTGATGVAIGVSPLDCASDGNGLTTFARRYAAGTAVTLTAPQQHSDGTAFWQWSLDGIPQQIGQATLNVTMNSAHTANAEYLCTSASATNYGVGRPGGSGSPPSLSATQPVIGQSMDLQIGNATSPPVSATTLLWGSASPDLVGPIHVLPPYSIRMTLTVPPGGLTVSGATPVDPALCGAHLYLQALQMDSTAAQGVSMSLGLDLLFGGL